MTTFKSLAFILLACLLYTGCNEKKSDKEFEVIKDYSPDYYTATETEVAPVAKRPQIDKGALAKSMADKKLFNKAGAGQTTFLYELYLNEKGTVDKVRIVEGMGDNLDDITVSQMKTWKYTPAKKNGKDVKCRLLVYWNFNFDPDGKYVASVYDNTKKVVNPLISEKIVSNSSDYFVAVEDMPEPIGGIQAIQKNIQYPEVARRAGIEGKVYVLTMINEKGFVDRVLIIRGLGSGLDEAAMDAVKKTRFKPGMQRGKPVKVQVSIPILFKLQ